MLLVDQNAHQFGNRQCRVGVVQLNGHLFGKLCEIAVVFLEAADDVLQ
jgi:hypothetical protein